MELRRRALFGAALIALLTAPTATVSPVVSSAAPLPCQIGGKGALGGFNPFHVRPIRAFG